MLLFLIRYFTLKVLSCNEYFINLTSSRYFKNIHIAKIFQKNYFNTLSSRHFTASVDCTLSFLLRINTWNISQTFLSQIISFEALGMSRVVQYMMIGNKFSLYLNIFNDSWPHRSLLSAIPVYFSVKPIFRLTSRYLG